MALLERKTFVISTGYVEDALIGNLCIDTQENFETTSKALYQLGKDLFDCLEDFRISENEKVDAYEIQGMRDCCIASKKLGAATCSKCWTRCKKNEVVTTPSAVVDTLSELCGKTNDQAGYDLYKAMGEKGWEIGGMHWSSAFSMIVVSNYCWHNDYEKYGTLGSEWKEFVVNPESSAWVSNNPKSIYTQSAMEDEEDEEDD